MLNEIMEAEAYLNNPKDEKSRVNAKLLLGKKKDCKLMGIADILTLVAAAFIFRPENEGLSREQLREAAISIMRIWCGFDEADNTRELEKAKEKYSFWFDDYPAADGWLKEYLIAHLTNDNSPWEEYSETWRKKLNSAKVYTAESISYDSILSNVFARGPLKNYYLAASIGYPKALTRIKNDKDKTPDSRKQRTILKLIAAYEVLRQCHPDQKYVLLQTNRVLNWLGFKSDNSSNWCTNLMWEDNEPLFIVEGHQDFKKFCVNQNFLNDMKIKLEEAASCSKSENTDYYYDTGHGSDKSLELKNL